MTPYYEEDGITIYHADCREVLPRLKGDALVTDPPYPDYYTEEYAYHDRILDPLANFGGNQLVFWTAKRSFPLSYSAVHVWDKKTGCGSQYERIFERSQRSDYKVFRYYLINSTVAASFTGDTHYGHPSQKPIALMLDLIQHLGGEEIIDPFMGSGTTLEAAKKLGKSAIGIEIEEKYCEIAAKRLSQKVLNFEVAP